MPDHTPSDGPAEHGNSMLSTIKLMMLGLAVIAIGYLLLNPISSSVDGTAHAAVGRSLDMISLAPLLERQPLTASEMRGKVTLVNFWGTWCPPCRMELPHLVEMNERLAEHTEFQFVTVSCGSSGPHENLEKLRSTSEQYLRETSFDLRVYADPGATARATLIDVAQLQGFAYPTTVLLDRAGTIKGLWLGYAPGIERAMEQAIRAELAAGA